MISININNKENLLVGAIYQLIILDEYYDRTRVGKDDYESDFLIISNFKDEYIYFLVTNYLDTIYERVSETEKKFVVKYRLSWTFNGLARYPRQAFIINRELENYRKLWLIEKLVNLYDANVHLLHFERDYFSNSLSRLYWKYSIKEVTKKHTGYDYEIHLVHPENAMEDTLRCITISNDNPDLGYIEDLASCLLIDQHAQELWEVVNKT